METTEIIARFLRERQRWDKTVILDARDERTGDPITIKTTAEEEDLELGSTYRWYGSWGTHHRWGKQFSAKTFVEVTPLSKDGVIAYLCKAPHVGATIAAAIWRAFECEAVAKLRQQPLEVVAELKRRNCKGFTETRAEEAAAYLREESAVESATIELLGVLQGRGFPRETLKRSLHEWGNRAAEVVRRNPYRLMQFPGCGFARTDSLYLDLGLPPAALKRQTLAVWYAMSRDSSGSTWFDIPFIEQAVNSTIASANANPVRACKLGIRAGLLRTYRNGAPRPYLTVVRRATAEERVAEYVGHMLRQASAWPAASELDVSDHQREQLALALAAPLGIFSGNPGTGKAQPLTAQIITPTGPIAMGSIRVGDQVMNSSGGISEVIGVYPQGEKDVFRVTFSDGSSTECCEDHLWLTTRRDQRQGLKRIKPYAVRPLKEIAQTLHDPSGSSNHSIPMAKALEFPEKQLPLDPYLLGLLIGDGCFRGAAVSFAKPEPEILQAISTMLPAGVSVKHRSGINHSLAAARGKRNGLVAILKDLELMGKLSVEKHIPNIYLHTSAKDRIELLQGLMDTDGYTDGHATEFSTSSPRLAEDFQYLVETLGGTTRAVEKQPTYTHNGERRNGKTSYRFCVCLPRKIIPFRMARKRDKYIPRTKYPPRRIIRSVESVGTQQTQCIAVSAPDRLYLTDHCILTHNTFTAARLINALVQRDGYGAIAVVAPTGKAAVRITEAMRGYGLDLRAKTIHSYLKVEGFSEGKDGGFAFTHGPDNPVEERYVIVDEASMLDVELLASLMGALPNDGHLLLVGDTNQLAPVGHGAPLRDLIAAGVPNGDLKEIRRNSGAIVATCALIRDQQPVEIPARLDLEHGGNIMLAASGSVEESAQRVVAIVRHIRDAQLANAVWETQVLVAVNEKSPCSRKELNRVLQAELNGVNRADTKFWPNDKIICLSNQFLPLLEDRTRDKDDDDDQCQENDKGEVYVANGELGRVIRDEPRRLIVEFPTPERIVIVPKGEDGATEKFDLGYAISGHKSQGSEWPVVIVALDDSFGARMVCDRSWIYTAISRAKKACILVGAMTTINAMTRSQHIQKRLTFLTDRIQKAAARKPE